MNKIKELSNIALIVYKNYFIKLALLASFFVAIVFDPAVVAGKGMVYRAPIFMASSVIIPLVFLLKGISLRNKNYPHLADLLIALPFLLDTLGNLLGIYNRYNATDDVLHFINWFFLIPGIMALVFRNRKDAKDFILIAAGISAMAIVGWEAFEWLISDAGPFAGKTADTLTLSYGDTIGDLVISLSGGVIGSLIARLYFFKKK